MNGEENTTGLGGAITPKPMNQTEAQFQYAEKELTILSEVVAKLEGKLGNVLRKENEEKSEGKDREELVGIASAIRGIGMGVESNVERLCSIIERLEI